MFLPGSGASFFHDFVEDVVGFGDHDFELGIGGAGGNGLVYGFALVEELVQDG